MARSTITTRDLRDTAYLWGDGSDGDATIAADTDLTRAMFYDDLTINSTKKLNTHGFPIYARTITNNGTIRGCDPASLVGGAGTGAGGGTAGDGEAAFGAALTDQGGVGGDHTGTAGANGDEGHAGGAGGAGGAGAGAAGTAGTVTKENHKSTLLRGSHLGVDGTLLRGGAGGSGGGGSVGGGGGGGGAGGVPVLIRARTISGSGTVESIGGAGGAGNTDGGGGGGGGGGVIHIVTATPTNPWTTDVSGGAGGALAGTGAVGTAGSAGQVIYEVPLG